MTDDSRVQELLLRWEEQRHSVSPEDLCRDCPELLGPLRARVQVLEALARALQTASSPASSADGLQTASSRASSADGLLPLGTVLSGRYRLDSFIGQGGMGRVYRATHLVLDHPVAVKVLRAPEQAVSELARARFRSEARIALGMDHPHLVRVFDCGQEAGSDYLVMEWIDGAHVGELIRSAGRLAVATALQIAQAALGGLAALHAAEIVHRDVKPANLLVRRHDLHVKVSDFGLAIQRRPGGHDGGRGGTPPYMAPEVIAGHEARPASDVFSFGVSLFEMLMGHRPWSGSTLTELWDRMLRQPPPELDAVGAAVTGLAAFVARCLERDPEERFRDARAAGEQLADLMTGLSRPRLLRNRLAVVLREAPLAAVLAAALGSTGFLNPVLTVGSVTDPRLAPALGQIDAVLLDLDAGTVEEVEQFVGGVRERFPDVVFFLLTPHENDDSPLGRFSAEWQRRFRHYFRLPLEGRLTELPARIEETARQILWDQGQLN